jgi:hypothetical protein
MHPIAEKVLFFTASFIIFEILSFFIFKKIKQKFLKSNNANPSKTDFSFFKGMLERFMLLLGFVFLIPTIIVFFGAIKLGTRFKENSETIISNDYFLIGNTISATIALLQYALFLLLTK